MKRKAIILSAILLVIAAAGCGTGEKKTAPGETKTDTVVLSEGNNPNGIGRFSSMEIAPEIDTVMTVRGEAIYKAKCFSCHKLTEEKLVGPGWEGVTGRRKPEWIMNF